MDRIALEQVADAMIAEPALKPMTAMKAIYDTGAFRGPGYRQRLPSAALSSLDVQQIADQRRAINNFGIDFVRA
jgi:hypothetical protein